VKRTLIIAGLGRCGTTAVMRELDAAGYPVLGAAPNYLLDIDPFLPPPEGIFKWTSLEWHLLADSWFPGDGVDFVWMSRDPEQQALSFRRRHQDRNPPLIDYMEAEWEVLTQDGSFAEVAAELKRRSDLSIESLLRRGLRVSDRRFEDLVSSSKPAFQRDDGGPSRGMYRWGREIIKRGPEARPADAPLERELLALGPPKRVTWPG
jgi:hypothetical protein